jgi:flagellar biosynthesis chaperone FliJ
MASLEQVSSLAVVETSEKEFENIQEFEGWWETEQEHLRQILSKAAEDNKEFKQLLQELQENEQSGAHRSGSFDDSGANEAQIAMYTQQIFDLQSRVETHQTEVGQLRQE